MWLNFGKFQENGGCGYVLKPPHMLGTGPKMLPCQLAINVLSCQRLPNNAASSDIVDVYVVVEVHGWQSDAQVPPPCCASSREIPPLLAAAGWREGRGGRGGCSR